MTQMALLIALTVALFSGGEVHASSIPVPYNNAPPCFPTEKCLYARQPTPSVGAQKLLNVHVCHGLNNYIVAIVQAFRYAQAMDYTLCLPLIHHHIGLQHLPVRLRFGDVFDEEFVKAEYAKRGVRVVSSLNGDADRLCSNTTGDGWVNIELSEAEQIRGWTAESVRAAHGGKNINFKPCMFSYTNWHPSPYDDFWIFRPAPPLALFAQSVRTALQGTKTGPTVALHLRIEEDWQTYCRYLVDNKFVERSCFFPPEDVAKTVCERMPAPCNTATLYVMTGARPDEYMGALKPRFGKVYNKASLMTGEVLDLGREINGYVDFYIAVDSDYLFGVEGSTFFYGLKAVRKQKGLPTETYSTA